MHIDRAVPDGLAKDAWAARMSGLGDVGRRRPARGTHGPRLGLGRGRPAMAM